MRTLTLGLAAATLTAGLAFAQTTSTPATSTPATTPATTQPATTQPATTRGGGTAAASGDDNQAVATTSANAPTPAKGHNSFSRGEARRRISARGFSGVANLHKDADGIWRASATHDGAPTDVWLDYKGNVGTGQS